MRASPLGTHSIPSLTGTRSKLVILACQTWAAKLQNTMQKFWNPSKPLKLELPPKYATATKNTSCPFDNDCTQAVNVIYHATVKTQNSEETYVGSTTDFKKRFYNYNCDFSKPSRRNNTTLSAHMWTLKESSKKSDLTWKIIGKAPPFSPVTGTCQLCTSEKFKIIFNPEICSLNARNELFTHCRHKEKLLLVKHVRKKRKNGS